MKYLKSTTQKEYTFNGRHIPKCITKENETLALSDLELTELKKSAVVNALINSGAIIVLDEAPSTPTQQVGSLTNQVAALTMQNTKLAEELAELKNTSSASEEVNALKAALKKQEEDDRAEITQLAADKDAEIAKLKAQLEAATSASKTAAKAAEAVASGE